MWAATFQDKSTIKKWTLFSIRKEWWKEKKNKKKEVKFESSGNIFESGLENDIARDDRGLVCEASE